MSAIAALSTAASALRQNPVIFAVALLFSVVSSVSILLQFLGGVLEIAWYVVWFVTWPFLLGGFIGLIHEGLGGRASLDTFVEDGKSNYVRLLLATILFAIGMVGLVFAGMIAFIIVAVFGGVSAMALEGGAVLGARLLMIALVLIGMLIYLLLFAAIQFYDVAIVVSGAGAVQSFGHSLRIFRHHFLSVIGFTLLFSAISLLGQLPGYVLYFLAIEFPGPEDPAATPTVASEPLLALSVGAMLVFGTLAFGFAYTYFVAFYDEVRSTVESTAT